MTKWTAESFKSTIPSWFGDILNSRCFTVKMHSVDLAVYWQKMIIPHSSLQHIPTPKYTYMEALRIVIQQHIGDGNFPYFWYCTADTQGKLNEFSLYWPHIGTKTRSKSFLATEHVLVWRWSTDYWFWNIQQPTKNRILHSSYSQDAI